MEEIGWEAGGARWLNPPPEVLCAGGASDGGPMTVTAAEGSDFWRRTGYGFVRDTGHALLAPFPADSAVEVSFIAAFDELYDQAGAMVRVDARTWTKAGLEMSDGAPQLGAVVTREWSDWSLAPVPAWAGREVTVRVSRSGDALTVRARREQEPWRMVRLAPLDPGARAYAGPFCCSPQRAGLQIRFTRFAAGPADASLHCP
ncbi:DUF1349 domain-containing protein [Streptomyces rimosus]|uniref:DUF1349 domain-containing protein n=1 Tax=Streptomyces rimosus TaxID=1927 RepID=UPI000A7A222C